MSIDVNCSAWDGFRTGEWRHLVNVSNFIQKNYTPYSGDDSFLAPISEKTAKVWAKARDLIVEEVKKGIIDVEVDAVSGIDNFEPSQHLNSTDMSSIRRLRSISSYTEKRTMTVYLMHILSVQDLQELQVFSQDFLMLTEEAVL